MMSKQKKERSQSTLHQLIFTKQSLLCVNQVSKEFQVTELEMIPQSEVELSGEDLETFENFTAFFEDDEDVQKSTPT